MYQILVVDDEPLILESMVMLIKKHFPEVDNIYTANSGKDAIGLVYRHKPDAVFIDIKMPGINGLNAIREIQKKYDSIKFVIISAYEQFTYAQEAIELGVHDYLLKPVNKDAILDAVSKILKTIEDERKKEALELENRERIEKLLPFLESQFLYTMIFKPEFKEDMREYEKLLNISTQAGCILTVELEEPAGKPDKNSVAEYGREARVFEALKDSAKKICKCLVGNLLLNRFVVFISMDGAMDTLEPAAYACQIAEKLLSRIRSAGNFEFRIGIGGVYKGGQSMFDSYEESIRALKYAQPGEIVNINDAAAVSGVKTAYPLYKEKLFMEHMSLGNTEKSIETFNSILSWFTGVYTNSLESIKIGLVQILVQMYRLSGELEDSEVREQIENQEYLSGYFKISDLSELAAFFRNKIMMIGAVIEKNRAQKIDCIFTKVKAYIENNMGKDIKLEDAAKTVCLSPAYFSTIFHRTTGQSFIDYLNLCRLNKAKELMKNENTSMKEIAISVGYKNPNYFSRVFKNVFAVSPSEYKNSIQQ